MANPNTTTPASANGTEYLRRKWFRNQTTSEAKLIDGVAVGYIYTVLSVIINNNQNAAKSFLLYVRGDADATADPNLLTIAGSATGTNGTISVPAGETFVWDNKIVLADTDELCFISDTADPIWNIWCSYIEQRFV